MMQNNNVFKVLCSFTSFCLGLLFLWAGCLKSVDLAAFQTALKNVYHFPNWFMLVIILIIPGAEIVFGFCVIAQFVSKEPLVITTLLISIFVFLSIHQAFMGHEAHCACFKTSTFGLFKNFTGWWLVARDLFLFSCSTFLLLTSAQTFSKAGRIETSSTFES